MEVSALIQVAIDVNNNLSILRKLIGKFSVRKRKTINNKQL